MTDPIGELESSPAQPFRDDLARLYRAMRPSTIACVNVTDPSCLPLDVFLVGTSRVWMVDWEAGRPERSVARQLVQRDDAGGLTCLASLQPGRGSPICGSHVPGSTPCARFHAAGSAHRYCANFSLGREPRVVISDGSLGRSTYFAARVEELVALSATPASAVERAVQECVRAGKMDHSVDIASNSIELLISVLPPSDRVDGPFDLFLAVMARRFGALLDAADARFTRDLTELRTQLFVTQIDAHARELYRLVDKHVGGLYFATHPLDPASDGSWAMHQGAALAFEILSRYFAFDFESFPAEAFLRRQPHDKRVVQAALLRPLPSPSRGAPLTGKLR